MKARRIMAVSERPTGAMGPREAETIVRLQTEYHMTLPEAMEVPAVERARARDTLVDAVSNAFAPITSRIERFVTWLAYRLPK